MGFDSTSRTHVGHRRTLNEDSLLDDCGGRIWAVADGMGGHHAGEVASAMVVDALTSVARHDGLEKKAQVAIDALEAVNQALVELAQSQFEGRTIGSTVVGMVADEHHFACFWAGDSRGYQVSDGKIAQITRDHSLVQDLIDAGMLEPSEAESHPNANVVTRAVGAQKNLFVDAVRGEVQSGDMFLLASDGLTRLVGEAEMQDLMLQLPLAAAAERLIELSLERGAPDNVSLVIVRFT